MNSKVVSICIAAAFSSLMSSARAEAPKVEFPAPSPLCTIKQRVGITDIEIAYSRPSVKDREIFGGLVPYGKVWRTGANQATKIVFSTPVKLNGTEIPAGTYALMTIPGKDEWTIIINKGAEQWGAYKYDEKNDVARIKCKPVNLDKPVESFTISVDQLKDESAVIDLAWEKTEVPVKLEVDYVKKLTQQIEEVMSSNEEKKPYFQAAAFYYNHGLDLQKANKWVDAALSERDTFFINFLKAEILEKLGDKKGALAAAKHSSELAEKANDAGYVKLNHDLISRLQ